MPTTNVVLTLDPNKFAEKKQQRLHIGDLHAITVNVPLTLQQSSTVVVRQQVAYDFIYNLKTATTIRLPYPPNTKAFLYYSIVPAKPRIAGELRLRVTSSDDPTSFESGSDLLLANGRAWARPLYTLSKLCLPLYEKLREDRLISDDLESVLSNLPSKKQNFRRRNYFYTLNDTFIFNFSHGGFVFFVITEQGVERLVLQKPFTDHRITSEGKPYTGAYKMTSLGTPMFIILMNL